MPTKTREPAEASETGDEQGNLLDRYLGDTQ